MPLTEKGQKIMSSMKDQYGPEKGESVFYASKNKGTIEGVDCGWRPTAFTSDAVTGQTAEPIRSTPTTVGRAGQQMGQDPGLNNPASPSSGGFRDPQLTEKGDPRVPSNKYPSDRWMPPKFDQQPHPPVDPIAEACEFAAGITGDPNRGESAASKNDHAASQVFHERMARFHQARHEDDKAAAHMAASGAHQQAARTAGDKSYRRGMSLDQVSQNARECSVKANFDSGFGRGFGGKDNSWLAPDWGASGGQIKGPMMAGRDQGESQNTSRYQLVDRQTGDCFDVNVPDHVQFTRDAGVEKLTPQPIKSQPLKAQTLQPQTMRGTQDNGSSGPLAKAVNASNVAAHEYKHVWKPGEGRWESPTSRDAGTSEGAKKAAETRKHGGTSSFATAANQAPNYHIAESEPSMRGRHRLLSERGFRMTSKVGVAGKPGAYQGYTKHVTSNGVTRRHRVDLQGNGNWSHSSDQEDVDAIPFREGVYKNKQEHGRGQGQESLKQHLAMPGHGIDAGTSQGAQKAAQTRQAGGGASKTLATALKPGATPGQTRAAAMPKPAIVPKQPAAPKAPKAAAQPAAAPHPASPGAPKPAPAPAPKPAQGKPRAGGVLNRFNKALGTGTKIVRGVQRGVENVESAPERFGGYR